MPYGLGQRGEQWCAFPLDEDGTQQADPVPGGCHDVRADAVAHVRALNANVPEARAAAPCGCDNTTTITVDGAADDPLRVALETSRALRSVQGATLGSHDEPFPVPPYPPRAWFTERPDWLELPPARTADPRDVPIMKIGVDDSGRVAGYFYQAGQCLVHNPRACPQPSPTGYAGFHQQQVLCDDGELAYVGVIGNVHGHADPYARVDVAQRHYADPSAQLIMCRAYDDEHGGYILGSLVPTATYGDVALIRRCALSGDWRHMPVQWWQAHRVPVATVAACDGYDCIGPTLVTRPGLPLVRQFAAAAGHDGAILGGLGGIQLESEEHVSDTTTSTGTTTRAVGPRPAPAMAASPDFNSTSAPAVLAQGDPNAPGGVVETPEEEAAEDAAVQQLQAQMADVMERLGAVEDVCGQLIEQQMAPMAAAAQWPEPDGDLDWDAWLAAATKTEDGKNFGPGDYAYVPDANTPSTWKLRLTATPGGEPDAQLVGAAAAALSPGGFRGQPADIPDADRARVKAKVRAAWTKANPDKSPDEMPDSIKG